MYLVRLGADASCGAAGGHSGRSLLAGSSLVGLNFLQY